MKSTLKTIAYNIGYAIWLFPLVSWVLKLITHGRINLLAMAVHKIIGH